EGDNEEVAAEEEEEVGNDVEMEEETEGGTSTMTHEGENEEQEVKGEEETRCAICLGRIASGAAVERRQERWWLPCCHSFHRGCLQRWLQQKAECPPCSHDSGCFCRRKQRPTTLLTNLEEFGCLCAELYQNHPPNKKRNLHFTSYLSLSHLGYFKS
ncbi:hypothetical protein Taro_020710, partial [Colocasia esculenta]|nr:hypothetical protein [Colocasia esculenta]